MCVLQLVLCWGFCEHKVVLWCGSTSGLRSWSGQSTETQIRCVKHKDVGAVGCFTWTKTSHLTVRGSLVHTFYHKKNKKETALRLFPPSPDYSRQVFPKSMEKEFVLWSLYIKRTELNWQLVLPSSSDVLHQLHWITCMYCAKVLSAAISLSFANKTRILNIEMEL